LRRRRGPGRFFRSFRPHTGSAPGKLEGRPEKIKIRASNKAANEKI
jgi:hypothetical protein